MKKLTIDEKLNKLFENKIFVETFIQIRDNMIKMFETDMDKEEFESIMNFFIKEFRIDIFYAGWIKEYKEIYTEEEIDYMLDQQESTVWKSIALKTATCAIRLNEVSKQIGENLLNKYEKEKDNY